MARARNRSSWYELFLKFVAANPKMSAAIAFQLGVLAAEAAKGAERSYRQIRRHGFGSASGKILESMPGLPSLGLPSLEVLKSYVVSPPPQRRRKVAGQKAAATRVRRRARKAAASRSNRARKAAATRRSRKRRTAPPPELAAAA